MDDIDDLIKKAKEIGYDTVPDPKPIQAEKTILDILQSKITRCFQTKELDALLRYDGIRTPSSSTLTRLVNEEKIERVGYGKYRAKFMSEKQSLLEQIKLNLQKILHVFSV